MSTVASLQALGVLHAAVSMHSSWAYMAPIRCLRAQRRRVLMSSEDIQLSGVCGTHLVMANKALEPFAAPAANGVV